jgi:hypothetical protein
VSYLGGGRDSGYALEFMDDEARTRKVFRTDRTISNRFSTRMPPTTPVYWGKAVVIGYVAEPPFVAKAVEKVCCQAAREFA